MSKIKGLRQKTAANTYSPLVPFGTDGILVDMLSDLTLEEELKLGGNHISAINESGNNVVITETFKDNSNNIYYIVATTIQENEGGSTSITIELKDSNNTVLKTKDITIPAEPINNILTITEGLRTS